MGVLRAPERPPLQSSWRRFGSRSNLRLRFARIDRRFGEPSVFESEFIEPFQASGIPPGAQMHRHNAADGMGTFVASSLAGVQYTYSLRSPWLSLRQRVTSSCMGRTRALSSIVSLCAALEHSRSCEERSAALF